MMKRYSTLGLLVMYFAIASCSGGSEYDNIFVLSATPSQVAAVPIGRRSCVDVASGDVEAESVSEASLGFSSFSLSWRETGRDLFIVKIQLDVENTILATKIDIVDPDEIGQMFGVGAKNDVKIPRKGGVGATAAPDNTYRSDLKQFDLNNDGTVDTGYISCSLAFGGLALPEDTRATVAGFIRVTAIAQDDSANQEIIRQSIPIRLIIDTD